MLHSRYLPDARGLVLEACLQPDKFGTPEDTEQAMSRDDEHGNAP